MKAINLPMYLLVSKVNLRSSQELREFKGVKRTRFWNKLLANAMP